MTLSMRHKSSTFLINYKASALYMDVNP